MKITTRWGNPKDTKYDIVLDHFSGANINTIQTSSVPLAQYWKKTSERLARLSKVIAEPFEGVDLFFEYPTKSYQSNKASMTDLMIVTDDIKIAIEAKYTEYRYDQETIKKWLVSGDNNNRKKVLEHWSELIRPFVDSGLSLEDIKEIPYQFFHRTASACYGEPKKAYVVYQIFWDEETKMSLDKFKKLLIKSYKTLKPKHNLQLFIDIIKVKSIKAEDKNTVFQVMKKKAVYIFDEKGDDFERVVVD